MKSPKEFLQYSVSGSCLHLNKLFPSNTESDETLLSVFFGKQLIEVDVLDKGKLF